MWGVAENFSLRAASSSFGKAATLCIQPIVSYFCAPPPENSCNSTTCVKGCGFDLDALSGSEKKEFNMVLGVFPLHNPAVLKVLEDKWMPLSWPSNFKGELLAAIADYFGEEVGFNSRILTCA